MARRPGGSRILIRSLPHAPSPSLSSQNEARKAAIPEFCHKGEFTQCHSLAKAKCSEVEPPTTAGTGELKKFAESKSASACVCNAKVKSSVDDVKACEDDPKVTEETCKGNAACSWKCSGEVGSVARFMSTLRRFL